MPRLRSAWLVVILVATVAVTFARGVATGASEPGDGLRVARETLANGLRVVVVRDPAAGAVTTEMNYLVGSDEAPEGFPGMAHAQEHMMFRGSPDLGAAQLAYISAALGGRFDADTQQAVTQYVFTVAAQDLDVALRIEASPMRGVLDREDDWRRCARLLPSDFSA